MRFPTVKISVTRNAAMAILTLMLLVDAPQFVNAQSALKAASQVSNQRSPVAPTRQEVEAAMNEAY